MEPMQLEKITFKQITLLLQALRNEGILLQLQTAQIAIIQNFTQLQEYKQIQIITQESHNLPQINIEYIVNQI